MKKTMMLLLAVVWFAVAACLTSLMIYGMKKESLPFTQLAHFNFFSDDDSYDSYEETAANTFTTTYSAHEVNDFDINLISEKLIVRESKNGEVKVVVISSRKEQYRPRVKLDGDTLEIKEPSDLRNNWRHHFGEEVVELYVPNGYFAHDVDVNIVSGEVELSSLNAELVHVKSVSGAIQSNNCTMTSFDADSVSGSIAFEGKTNSFSCHSVSGALAVSSSSMIGDDSSAETVSGSVKISLPENAGFKLKYSTVSGHVRDEFGGTSVSKGSGTMSYGSNGPHLSVKTMSGSITVDKQ